MTGPFPRILVRLAGLAALLLLPFLAPGYLNQLALMWVMVLLALTWDLTGGQMGYNSFGNVVFFGIGCYVAAMMPHWITADYGVMLALGMLAGSVLAAAAAAILGSGLLGLRGQYFAIATLGLSLAAAELSSGWDYIGGGGGLSAPAFPGSVGQRGLFFYFVTLGLALVCLAVLGWLYRGRFGLVLNAIRDDEDKAEAMGLPTTRIKVVTWTIAAAFLGMVGAVSGYLLGYIDPRNVAFAGQTFGVWMVLMAILGGKGRLWGPVLGAILFHITQEAFWTYLLGWQRVALGALIVVIVLFFPTGILGWLRRLRPAWFVRASEGA